MTLPLLFSPPFVSCFKTAIVTHPYHYWRIGTLGKKEGSVERERRKILVELCLENKSHIFRLYIMKHEAWQE